MIWIEQEEEVEEEERKGGGRWKREGRGIGILKNTPGDSSVHPEAHSMVPAPFGTQPHTPG